MLLLLLLLNRLLAGTHLNPRLLAVVLAFQAFRISCSMFFLTVTLALILAYFTSHFPCCLSCSSFAFSFLVLVIVFIPISQSRFLCALIKLSFLYTIILHPRFLFLLPCLFLISHSHFLFLVLFVCLLHSAMGTPSPPSGTPTSLTLHWKRSKSAATAKRRYRASTRTAMVQLTRGKERCLASKLNRSAKRIITPI